jgi:hyperosmotically inducible periplasmic protein
MTHDHFKLIATSLLLVAALSACDKPGTAEKAGQQIDRATSDASKKIGETVDKAEKTMTEQSAKTVQAFDDSEITTKVKAAIFSEPGLKSLQISVDTVKGVVTLSGSVDSPANSDKAKSLAAAVAGVKEINNKLIVNATKQ